MKNLNFFNENKKLNKMANQKKIKYSFTFVSLVAPFITNNIQFLHEPSFSSNQYPTKNNNNNRLYLKQSYILLVWFYYLSFLNIKKDKKNKLSFFCLPVSKKIFTNTKAPMAHKNWSKEQYKFKIFKIRISISAFFDEDVDINTLNSSLFFIILNKKNFPFFETNLMFLKNFSFFFRYNDSSFFNYTKFISRK